MQTPLEQFRINWKILKLKLLTQLKYYYYRKDIEHLYWCPYEASTILHV